MIFKPVWRQQECVPLHAALACSAALGGYLPDVALFRGPFHPKIAANRCRTVAAVSSAGASQILALNISTSV